MSSPAPQKVSKFHRIDFHPPSVFVVCVTPKCQGLIINHGSTLRRDLHSYDIVVPGEVKCLKARGCYCPSSRFNEDGFRDEMLGVIKKQRDLSKALTHR